MGKFVTTKEALSRYAAKFPPQKVLRENTISAVKEVLDSDLSKIPLYEVTTPIKLGLNSNQQQWPTPLHKSLA